MSNLAIQFENVGKLYQLGTVGTGSLAHDLNRWWQTKILRREDPYLKIGETNDRSKKGVTDFVWALRDISFDVKQGDVVGIIGKNGAGKSTLLKLLSRVTSPSTGAIRAKGRIASLLEVGTGFHPEMTGRENIYMNGCIMGMTRQEITSKLDEIVDFAGVERYLDTPTKRYSSGMMVRLGFAVAAFLEPEILVVDEVLAVGDAEFQKKAIGKMQDVASSDGRTVLFVSHNMASMETLCNSGVLLENGSIKEIGNIKDVIYNYLKTQNLAEKSIKDSISWKKNIIQINQILVNGSDSSKIIVKSDDKYIDVLIDGTLTDKCRMDFAFRIKTQTNQYLATYKKYVARGILESYQPGTFTIHEKIKLPDILSQGIYNVDIILQDPEVEYILKAYDCVELTIMGHNLGFSKVKEYKYSGFMGLKSYSE